MKNASYITDKDYVIGAVDKRLYGSFVEHLGRVVYDGLYEPGHHNADEQGFRKDVIDAVRKANVSIVRYPGGNFVSGYRWTDGIGPVSERKRRLDLAWSKIETNEVGIDEFADWVKKAGVELMATVNLGTGTPQEAGEMVEYCNLPSGTYWSDLRRKNGHVDPHQVKLWCLGNEMDGDWQIGQLTAEDYGKKALQAARIMKWTDPSIELVACGSCSPGMATYPDWDRVVLEYTYDTVEYVSLHRYYAYDFDHSLLNPDKEDQGDIAYFPVDLQEYLRTVISAADYVKTKKHSRKTIHISFDEWNIISGFKPAPEETGEVKSTFTLRDVLLYGAILCTFLQNADRVKVACQALLVNAGGLFVTKKGGALALAPVFYPFQMMARYGQGVALQDRVSCPLVQTSHHGSVPAMRTAAVFNEQDGSLNVFIVNFDGEEDTAVKMDFRAFGNVQMIEHAVISGDLGAASTAADTLAPVQRGVQQVTGGMVDVVIPKSSWNMLRFKTGAA